MARRAWGNVVIRRVRNHGRIVFAFATVMVGLLAVGAFFAWRAASQFDDKPFRPSEVAAKTASTTLAEPGALRLGLQPIVSGLKRPIGIEPFPDGRLAVLEKGGRIRVVDGATLLEEPFLDISPLVRSTGSEDGLVGLSFHPGYASNGRFFITYTTEPLGVKIVEYHAAGNRAEAGSARLVLEYTTAKEFHLGGTLAFGKDGYLYISAGEGGPTYGSQTGRAGPEVAAGQGSADRC